MYLPAVAPDPFGLPAGVREILRHVFFDAQAVHGVCKGHTRQLFHLAALCQRAFACLLPDILQRLFCGCAAPAQGLVAGHGREQLPLQVIADSLAAPVVGALQVRFCIQDCGPDYRLSSVLGLSFGRISATAAVRPWERGIPSHTPGRLRTGGRVSSKTRRKAGSMYTRTYDMAVRLVA